MDRREVLGWAAGGLAAALAPAAARAAGHVPVPFDWDMAPPLDGREAFVAWMRENRGEDPGFLGQRWDRYLQLLAHHDLWDERDKRAYLLTPREEFVTSANLSRAYEWHYLDIGYGVTITGPHTVARMTNTIAVARGDKVLEIGTGSGYQSAYLSHLTDRIWSIEIIRALAERTRRLYDSLIGRGYRELTTITTKNADGYYGWEENAPFDKIIVTCGIDHVPPPLLQQLKPDGIMVIPVGPPGAQHVLKVVKQQAADGSFRVARSDIYNGSIVNFVPFTKLEDGGIRGTHNQ
ncbi:protein-L-isoaspartate O-methyltransferase family protein [Labrys wisconsinensis]|uniref:Protein-L-isoaspartate O-methyltransferase n=1 Tax=Labrys wisconsinensis TaxID=425677 RepID=A0ABU0JIK9_9HYPH|nr:protein-L-isoaspartate O-methyltransferase [Labrys wisconsinensis]MDQ0473341.1 protein-L-isoaspartate(D-aspartate) O-methyltransferase [Labrys wisconsinensis]